MTVFMNCMYVLNMCMSSVNEFLPCSQKIEYDKHSALVSHRDPCILQGKYRELSSAFPCTHILTKTLSRIVNSFHTHMLAATGVNEALIAIVG